MAKRRKKHNFGSRQVMVTRAALRQHNLAVVKAGGQHGLLDWKQIRPAHSDIIINLLSMQRHHWTLYLSVFCKSWNGDWYSSSEEISPKGQYRRGQVETLARRYMRKLKDRANPNEVFGVGWIALPYQHVMDEDQAGAVFEAAGAWKVPDMTALDN